MINKDDEQIIKDLDTSMLNEQISNDQFFDTVVEFEVSHSINIIEKLIHLSRFGNLLTLVVGNDGCGKTRLLDNFLSAVDDDCQVCHIKAQPLLSIDQLFQQVIESFAGETTFTGIPLTANQYEEWAEQLVAIPGNRLVVIDDAEVLSSSVLHELCQLSAMQQAKETPHLHLVLFGNYDLSNILEQASQGVLNEEGIYAIDIPALNDEEATAWLEYLLTKAGVVFLPEQDDIDEMLVNGQGNLALLEELAEEYAAISNEIKEFEKEPEPWKISAVGYWFGILTVLAMLVLGIFFFQDELTEITGIGSEPQQVKQVESQPILNASEKVTEPEVVARTISETMVEKEPELYEVEAIIPETETIESDFNLKNDTALTQPDLSLTETESPVSEAIESDINLKENLLIEDQNEEFVPEAETRTEEPDHLPSHNQTEEALLTTDEQLIMAATDESYALQIIGLSNEAAIKSFIAKNSTSNMLYYRSSLNSKPWYIVILGTYDTKDEVAAVRANLPTELSQYGPWIKSLKNIKAEISRAQQLTIE